MGGNLEVRFNIVSRTASLPRGSVAPPRRCTCKDFGSSKRIFFLSDAYLTLSDLYPYIGFKFVFDAMIYKVDR